MKQKPLSQSISSPSLLSLWGNKYASFIFLIMACALLFASGIQPKFAEKAHMSVANLTAPALDFVSRPFVHLANTSNDIVRIASLQSENARLRAENEKLRQWYMKALSLNTEVQTLRELSNLKVPNAQSFVTTRIIADPGNAFVKSLLVPVGEKNGVSSRQAVMSEKGLIGRVISARDNAARILLLTDVNSRIPVMIEGTGKKAILAGQNNDLPLLTHLPKDLNLETGMRILTSGHGGYFPVGLPVGQVVAQEDGQYGVRTFANMKDLLYVKIFKKPFDPNLIEADLR